MTTEDERVEVEDGRSSPVRARTSEGHTEDDRRQRTSEAARRRRTTAGARARRAVTLSRVRKATARACGPRARAPRAPLGRARLWATRACGPAWLQGAVFFPFLILRYIVYKCIYMY